MYNSRDDKSFTRVRNYRSARRYRVFSAVISRGTPKKVNNQAAGQIFASDNDRFVSRLKERLSRRRDLLENYKQRLAGNKH